MKTSLLKVVMLLSTLVTSMNVMAHGDHVMVSPDHGLEHAAYYGIGVIAAMLVLNLGRKMLQKKNQ